MERTFWNKLRILVTNKCNYKCHFCHNEGQPKEELLNLMNLKEFQIFIDYLNDQNISELHFSGGEPFLNKDIVRMIEYVDKNTNWGIGCATNLSRITQSQIEELSKTRVKFNIQFPYASSDLFMRSTGNGNYKYILNQIKLATDAGIKIGLNAVVQNDDVQNVRDLISFSIEKSLTLKLLPQIGLNGSNKFKELIYPILKECEVDCINKKTGALKWIVENNGKRTSVLYIDSPCFNKDINVCREFGELRIHPDFSLQPCILNDKIYKLNLYEGKDKVLSTMTKLWNDFESC